MEGLLNIGNKHESFTLLFGVLAVLTSVFFFLQKFAIIQFVVDITDETYMFFFGGLCFFCGIVMLLSTLGFIGTK
jgi:hypothetical protein